MSLNVCLTDLHAQGKISDARFEALRPRYEALVAQYRARHGQEAAESLATHKVLELADAELLEKKRRTLLQAKRQGELLTRLRGAGKAGEPLPAREAEQVLIDMDGHRRAIGEQAMQLMYGLLAKHRRDLRGRVRNPDDLQGVLAELWGRDSGSVNAREIADSWQQTSEWLRSRFNAAGGHIGKLEAWRLPQRHDMRHVLEAGFDGWRDFIVPLLDRSAIIDRTTGEPMADDALDAMLQDMWRAIATDNWSRNTPGQLFGGTTGNSRADHRVLHFASPEAWTAYAERFGGGGSAFDAMLAHVEGMARDIAAMEVMGPNPDATLRFMQDWMDKSTADAMADGWRPDLSRLQRMTGARATQVASDAGEATRARLQAMFDTFTGAANRPQKRRLALGFSMFRSQQVAAKLGSAMLSVGGDYGLMVHTARFNGIPAAKVMGRYAAMLNPANTADRAQAARHVLMASQWADSHAATWRATGEEIAHEGARRLATGVMRASGLAAHTDIARQAFAMETVAHWTHQRERAFGNLDPAFAGLLQRYGIGEAEWDTIRGTAPASDRGTDWLYPEVLAQAGHGDIADNLMRLLVSEADYAVPVPDLRTRAVLATSFKKGTWVGEIASSALLFKGFPLTVLNMHGRRMLEQGTRGQAAGQLAGMFVLRYGVSMLALTTIGGALSVQVKEIARGKDPLPMDDAKFWGAALAQGGGLGIIGDFLFSMTNRFDQGIAQTLAGPGAQAFDNTVGMTVRNLAADLDRDDETESRWRKDVARAAMSEVPGMSLWYARLTLERTLGDMIEEWAYGEDIGARYNRLDQYAAERGTAYWAPPGLGVQRVPDWQNLWGAGHEEQMRRPVN